MTAIALKSEHLTAIFHGGTIIKDPQFTKLYVRGNFHRRKRVTHQKFIEFKQHRKDVLEGRVIDIRWEVPPHLNVKYTNVVL